MRFEEDSSKSRNHYVASIVIAADNKTGIAVKLTSNPTWNEPSDVQLLDYKEAGLAHLTTARCAQLIRFQRSDLQGFVGRLSSADAWRIRSGLDAVPAGGHSWL
ncbi:hypothetical protein KIM372_02240 [Bombiscardovia nodaiensis]|uniref:PemK-like protein n=1 Tax=Bombiscardovia nodaiensis TaxID=2932181 RepID=A0ABM8B627_9BIFI|nr:hypothetical protein KIM372_02240 [Bombiscardovia nodaiensis]